MTDLLPLIVPFVLIVVAAGLSNRANRTDRMLYDVTQENAGDQKLLLELVLHIRQDLKAVTFLLAAVIIAIGLLPLWL